MAEFGNSFRSARESRGLTIEAVAQETRISARFLRAIEAEAFDELPGGVFNRGFVRSYATEVGLDPSAMVEAYAALSAEQPPEETRLSPAPAPTSKSERIVLPMAIGGLAVVGLLFWFGLGTDREPADTRAPVPTGNQVARPVRTSRSPGLPNVDAVGPVTERSMAITQESPGVLPVAGPRPEDPAGPDPVAAEGSTGIVATPPAVPAEIDAAEETSVAPATEDDGSFRVRLEVLDTTRVYVALDGSVLYPDVVINPPFWRNYTVDDALELRIADPSAVSLRINGEPAQQLGSADENWRGTITRENMNELTSR